MEGNSLILAICRAFQLLFAIVVVGTSASLTKFILPYANACQGEGCSLLTSLVPRVEFGIFVGALGMVDAAMGMVSAFMDLIPYLIQLGADVLAGLSYVAGGAVIAAYLAKPFLCTGTGGEHCTQLKADDAFMFLGFIMTVVIIGLSFMWRGRTGKSGSYV